MTLYRASRRLRLPAGLPALLLMVACAASRAPPATPAPAAPAPAASTPAQPLTGEALEIQQAAVLIGQRQFARADQALQGLLARRDFEQLDPKLKHRALQLEGVALLGLGQAPAALGLLRRACELRETDARDWYWRIRADLAQQERADAVAALVTFATRWPKQLPHLEEPQQTLSLAVQALNDLGTDDERVLVLEALTEADFAEQPENASNWWRDLALLHLARDERSAAIRVLARVTDPYVVVSIEADKRFDPIRATLAARLNVTDVGNWNVSFLAAEVQQHPQQLEASARLAASLIDTLRLPQSLQVSEAAIERIDEKGAAAYSDYDADYSRIITLRASALYNLGRWDAALGQLKSASALPAGTGVAVLLDLAGEYAGLGRPEEALVTLRQIARTELSTYGETQVQLITLLAQAQRHDEHAVALALDYLSAHRTEAVQAYQEGLLAAGRTEQAAQLLIQRLEDPRLRSDALLAVQEYGELMPPPPVLEEERRWRALIARPEVQAAINRVGSARRYALAGGFN
jgi:beta-barrel assembly-enhancing protease